MEISLMIALASGVWFWFDSIAARETAVRLGRDLAERCGLQMLDETVAVTGDRKPSKRQAEEQDQQKPDPERRHRKADHAGEPDAVVHRPLGP